MMLKIAFTLLVSVLLCGCQALPKSLGAFGSNQCLQQTDEPSSSQYIIAYGSADNMEQAKDLARMDLVQQISSTVNATSERHTQVNNRRVDEFSAISMSSESKHIPIDQHQIEQICQSSGTYYVQVSLSKEALLHTSKARLQQHLKAIQKVVNHGKQASRYERYLMRDQLITLREKVIVLKNLLAQYSPNHSVGFSQSVEKSAERFIDTNSQLNIYIKTAKSMELLLQPLEHALQKADLKYARFKRDAAINIHIIAPPRYAQDGRRHITNLTAILEVRRADTNELLATIDLGKQNGVSTANKQKSLNAALKRHRLTLKRRLQGDKVTIRKTLGII